jgi:CheY-like chemotaxis protein
MNPPSSAHNPANTPPQPRLVLAIEDSDEDYEAMRRCFRQSSMPIELHRCKTGDRALAYLEQCLLTEPTSLPALILLDLNLPGIDGRRVIQIIKQDPRLQCIPVIVLTTSNYAKDVEECYRAGANSYIIKAMDIQRFKDSMQITIDYWLNTVTLA